MRALALITAFANKAVVLLGAAALALMPTMMLYDVVARYLFRAPTIWAMELSIYALQLVVFLPMGLLASEDNHIKVTLLTDVMNAKVQRILRIVSLLGVCVFAVCLTWWGWKLTAHSWVRSQVSPTLLAVPLWIPHSMLPIGGALLFISALGAIFAPSQPSAGTHGASLTT